MTLFNISIALVAGFITLIPILFVASRKLRYWIVMGALLIAVATYWLSSTYLYDRYVGWQFEAALRKQPIFNIIAKHHPHEFNEFLNKIKSNIDKDKSQMGATYSAELINKVFYVHLEKAPNNYIELYLKSTIALYQYLNGLSPRTILKLENIQIDDPSLPAVWQDKQFRILLTHLLDTKRYIIESSINNPTATPTEKEAVPLLAKIIQTLEQQNTPEIVRAIFSNQGSNVPPHIAANVIIQFYNLILAGGPEKAGIVMRYMAHLKNKK